MTSRNHILLAAFLLSTASYAQSTGLGLKGGIVLSSTKALNVRSAPLVGGAVGLYLPIGLARRVELQPELLAMTMGATMTDLEGERSTLRSVYLQLPVSIKIYLSSTFHLSGGYQVAKLLHAGSSIGDSNTNVTDQFKSYDTGFIGGFGLDLRSGLDINLRAYGGMSRILRNDDALFMKNRALQLSIGYRIVQFKRNTHFHKRR